ncbi:right-handed parallel beta-helix repeat-containing protein [Paludibacter jiangxiensis]|uniref:Right handed beta helix region protein n=1 Tax=Paludibacter jiangxiensis TaxID=681398 RepID=A0A170Z0P0_9BACT|nr:right-handed parallel beta-helix repeat-containing protein [Paludibacter jiangxiensis]GAT62238.1 right handed beta helix region protein [Paludibacter jiangxiensis]
MKSFFLAGFMLASVSLFATNIYVSPSGNDAADASVSAPKATLSAALRDARNLRRLQKVAKDEAIHIILKGGTYFQYEPVFVRPEDNGTESSPTIIEAAAGELPVLSGGMKVTGWQKQGKFWVADVPDFNGIRLNFRQLWVNGAKAVRARDVADFTKMNTILKNDKKHQTLWVPASAVRTIAKAPHAELVIHQMWGVANLRIKSIIFHGDSAGVKFHNPESRIQFEHPWPSPTVGKPFNNSAFYLTNAIQLLDQPGEWFYDQDNGKLYYMPRPGEDMRKAEAIVPAIETLVNVEGTLEKPVQYITFKGIAFNHTTWTRPSEKGHVPLQAGMYLLEGYKLRPAGVPGNENKGIENQAWVGRPVAAVALLNTSKINFEGCRFEHLGSCALDVVRGSQSTTVEGCLFRDIAGNGLQIGSFSEEALESHLPYDPADIRVLCSGQNIKNNYITDVTNEDWGCVGIAAGFVRNINIEHNEINEVSYSGISVGWGWTKSVNAMRNNRIFANYIHHYAKHMYDVAGIYTLSVQTKSTISENVVDSIYSPSYAHDPKHWFYLYTDEGSSFITMKDNWTPSEKYLKNANGPGNTWENNGPQVSDSIKTRAGLEPKYLYLKKL